LADCKVWCTGRFDVPLAHEHHPLPSLVHSSIPIRIFGEARIRLFAVDGAETDDKTVGEAFVYSSVVPKYIWKPIWQGRMEVKSS
jgi:hypothetical protein